jgi:hypothetical protein
MKNSNVNRGGVSFETSRNAYRGSVTILGTRHRTKYYRTKIGARRALTSLINTLTKLNDIDLITC